MAFKNNWTLDETVMPKDMNDIGKGLNDLVEKDKDLENKKFDKTGGRVTGTVNADNVQVGGSNVYHTGRKPTPADIGAVASTGGDINGNINIIGDKLITQRRPGQGVAIMRATATAGEFAFGGNADENATSMSDYIRIGRNKLEYQTNDSINNIYHSGNLILGGRNLIPSHAEFYEQGFLDGNGSPTTSSNSYQDIRIRSKSFININKSRDIILKFFDKKYKVLFNCYDDNGVHIKQLTWIDSNLSNVQNLFPEGTKKIKFMLCKEDTSTITPEDLNIVPLRIKMEYGTISSDWTEAGETVSYRFNNKIDKVDYEVGVNGTLQDISSQDIKTINKSGRYKGVNVINAPLATSLYFDIEVHSSTYKKVVAKNFYGSDIWMITCNNNTWTDWIRIYNSANKPTPEDIGALNLTGGTINGKLGVTSNINTNGSYQFSAKNILRGSSNATILSSANSGDIYLRPKGDTDTTAQVIVSNDGTVKADNVQVGGNNVYHTGRKPIPTEIGAASTIHSHDDRYYTEAEINTKLESKVDKVAGKQLSANDYTTTEKNKLAGIASGANAYTHPSTHPASIITQDATHRFATDAEKSKWNTAIEASKITNAGAVPSISTGTINTKGYTKLIVTYAVVNKEHDSPLYLEVNTTTGRGDAEIQVGGTLHGEIIFERIATSSNKWSYSWQNISGYSNSAHVRAGALENTQEITSVRLHTGKSNHVLNTSILRSRYI